MQSTLNGFVLAACLALMACAGTPETATLADGSVATRIDCDGSANGLNRCFERAGRSCGAAGYTVVDKNGVRLAGSRVGDPTMETLVKAYEMDKTSILVRCGS